MSSGGERSAFAPEGPVGAGTPQARSPRGAARVPRPLAVIAMLLAAVSCSREAEPPRAGWTRLDLASAEPAPVRRLDLRDPAEQDRWVLRNDVRRKPDGPSGLGLVVTGPDPFVSRALDRGATALERVVVHTADAMAGDFVVYLAVAGRESEAWAVPTHAVDATRRSHEALVGGVSWLDGPVDGIRLDPPAGADAVVVTGVDLERAADARPHRVGDEVRACLPATEVVTRRRVSAPASLQVGVGVPAHATESDEAPAWTLRITAATSGSLLARRTVRPPASPTWQGFDLELGGETDEPIALALVEEGSSTPVTACFTRPIAHGARPRRAPDPARPDILLVSLDTLRADALEHAPHLRSLAERGRSFDRVWASASWTLPSHVSLFTSTPVLEHDTPRVSERRPFTRAVIPPDLPLLAERLAEGGYRTAASTGGGYLAPEYGFARGFERYRAARDRSGDAPSRHLAFVDRFVDDAGAGPFFLFVHTYAVHDYFVNDADYHAFADPAADAERMRSGSQLEAIRSGEASPDYARRLYAAGVLRADAFVESLVERTLARTGDRPLLVVVTSDHGESFGEVEGVWHHGTSLEDEQLRIPLIVWGNFPEAPAGGHHAAPTSLIDVAPSLLTWLGLPVPETFRGARDRLLARPATARSTPILAGTPHTTRPHGARRIDQSIVVPPLSYIRTDRPDGRTTSETCLVVRDVPGRGERTAVPLARCDALRQTRAETYRRIARHVLVVDVDPPERGGAPPAVELVLEPASARAWSAAHARSPSATALAESPGAPIRWQPAGPDDFLVVHADAPPERVVDRVAARKLDLRPGEPGRAGESTRVARGGGLDVTWRGAPPRARDDGEPRAPGVPGELRDRLEALGYAPSDAP